MNLEKRVVMMDVDKIMPAAFNPPARTTSQALLDLKRSIEEIGIIYPLIVSEKGELIDGHRRLACAKALNQKSVPVIVVKGDARRIFDDVNRTSRKLSTRDELLVYLSGGPVSREAKNNIEKLEGLIGKEALQYAAENRKSAKSVLHVLTVLKGYIGDQPEAFWKKAAKWVVYNNQQFALRVAIQSGMEKALLIAAIQANTPVG